MPRNVFTSLHRVSYAECTLGNHVYHSRYLDILERARAEFFRSLGCPLLELQEEDAIFPITACELRFYAMARYDDLLTVEQWLSDMGRARLTCAGRLKNADGLLLFESSIHLVCTTVAGKPRRMPVRVADALQAYEAGNGESQGRP